MAASPKVLAVVLAGGEGKRLMPLTAQRAKPAVPFGGTYRLIDFALSNLVNSGYKRIIVLTQYKSHSLDVHISRTWRMSQVLGEYVSPVPAQQRVGKHWYLGSADAIFQCLNIIEDEKPDIMVIVSADHVYRMDFSQMVDAHIDSGAEFTVAGIRQPVENSHRFGVIHVDPDDTSKIAAFEEKPETTKSLPDAPGQVLASMGNYVANTDALVEAVIKDSESLESEHDMGGNIAPWFAARGTAGVYDFKDNDVPGSTDRDRDYWRDVGTIDSFYDAHMDIISLLPVFNLYNMEWPVHTTSIGLPPAKFVHAGPNRLGHATDSIVSPGVVISGGEVHGSILGPQTHVHSWSSIEDSVLFDEVAVERHAQVNRAILDKNVYVGRHVQIGVDREHDLARGFTVTDSGITVVPKGMVVDD